MSSSEWQTRLREYGPYAILLAALVFMIWVRTRPADRVITDTAVFFAGNDPWYHARIVQLATDHFLSTPGFDPFSYFPYGTGRHSGFGGLFDQLIALAALIVGIGNPSTHLVDVVTAYAPVVFGAATLLPAYAIAKRLTGRWAGGITAGLLALMGGQFLSRTVVGSADHQSAEPFFGTLAIFGFVYAVLYAYREKPTVADLQDRNWRVLRPPVVGSALGGVAVAAYLMTWPPGVMLVFTMGLFVVIQAIYDHLAGRSVEYLAFGTAGAMGTATLLTLGYAKTYALEATAFSLLQPLVTGGIAVGAVVLLGLSRYIRTEDYDDQYYPVAVIGLIAGVLAIAAVVFPRSLVLLNDLVVRVYSFGLLTSPSALTVAEIRPANLQDAWRAFGALFYVAIIGVVLLIARVIRENRPLELLVVLWSFTVFSAYFTSIRFGYYMAVNVAVLGGFTLYWVGHQVLKLDTTVETIEDLEAYQIIGVIIILIAVVPGNVVAIEGRQPVWQTADRLGGSNQAWHNELAWMQNNTPEYPDSLDYTDLYDAPEDGDFDYPDGAYGVMSWWDYGHWITVQAHRIPNANPFQQGPRAASAYLQARNETRANLILEALPSIEGNGSAAANLSNAELRELIAQQSPQQAGEDTRYVVIDDQMVAGKFAAIATWTGPGYNAYLSRQEFELRNGDTAQLLGVNRQYEQMMMSRLYFQDARGLEHYRLVHESGAQTTFVSVAQSQGPNAYQSTNFINRRLSPRILQAVQARNDLFFYDIRRASRVKVFERVPGARLVGTANTSNRTSVFAVLRLQTNTGRNITYIQQTTTAPDGSFNLTVPYATDDAVDPADGGTDSGVTAMGNYSISVGNPLIPQERGQVSVPESAIYENRTIEVELQAVQQPNITTGNQSSLRIPGSTGTEDRESSIDPTAGLDAPTALESRARVARVG